MLEITEYAISGTLITKLSGRLDGVNSEDINKYIATILDKGIRKVICDFSEVNYISSAGLRVILINQKKMTSAGGEIVLFQLSQAIHEVFKMSGFLRIFRVIASVDELVDTNVNTEENSISTIASGNIILEVLKLNDFSGSVETIGNLDKIENSRYSESDVIEIAANDLEYAFGFASIGNGWENVKDYFGESVVINKNLFVFPAVKRPAVDFMICSDDKSNAQYSFLNGFKISGKPSSIVSFKTKDSFVKITDLLGIISNSFGTNNFGFTIIAESKGIRGMNLKKIPTIENKPTNNKSIFDNDNFVEWVNFPVDQDDFNAIIAGVGFYVNTETNKTALYSKILPSDSQFHLHCGIFEKTLLNFKPDTYQQDLNIILNELEAKKVQHILSDTVFSMGTLSIIKMED